MKEKWSQCSKSSSTAKQKLGEQFRSLNARMATCRRTLARLQDSTKATKNKVGKQVVAQKKEKEQKDTFLKHDADGDGKLCREEVATFAQMEYHLDVSANHLDRICTKLIGNDTGVSRSKMTQLHQMLRSIQNEEKLRQKKEEKEKQKRKVEDQKAWEEDQARAAEAA